MIIAVLTIDDKKYHFKISTPGMKQQPASRYIQRNGGIIQAALAKSLAAGVNDTLVISKDGMNSVKVLVENETDSAVTFFLNPAHFDSVAIGSQVWMAENYTGTDGFVLAQDYDSWQKASNSKTPAYCYWYDSTGSIRTKYGPLYNWWAAKAMNVPGWHVPAEADFLQLKAYLGGGTISGEKVVPSNGWTCPIAGTNSSGFSASPTTGGDRAEFWIYSEKPSYCLIWYLENPPPYESIFDIWINTFEEEDTKGWKHSIRLLKDN